MGQRERTESLFHMYSTIAISASLLAMGLLSPGCTKEAAGPPKRLKSPPVRVETLGSRPAPKDESPEELSYRLRPRLVASPDGSGDLEIPATAPLLALDRGLQLGILLVLRRPGGDEVPGKDELEKIRALGKSLPEILARNLRQLLSDKPAPVLKPIASVKTGLRAAQLMVDRPGIEALILLPEFWDLLEEKYFQRKVVLALPGRNKVWFYPAEETELLDSLLQSHFAMHRDSGDPLCKFYIVRKDGRLLPGKRFTAKK